MDEMPVVPVVGNQPNNDMTKAELEKEVERLRNQIKGAEIEAAEQEVKSKIEQYNEDLEEDAGELDAGIGTLGPLFLLAIPFLIVAANYRSRARKAKETHDLEMMRMYTEKAKRATKYGNIFVITIVIAALLLFLIGLYQIAIKAMDF